MHSILTSIALALPLLAAASPVVERHWGGWTPPLRALASWNGIYAGAAMSTVYLYKNETYTDVAAREFNFATPENEMKWESTENVRGQFTFSGGDEIVTFAHRHGISVRGHTLVWHSQVPAWLQNLTAPDLKSAMKSHINGLMHHYKGQLYSWDVVNEALDDSGTYRTSFWYNTLGASFIEKAFRYARKADPHVKLYYNDYNIEGINAKSDFLYPIVKDLKKKGLIDGVGFQAHFITGGVPDTLQANLQRFADLGVEVAITELDDRMVLPPDDAKLKTQADDYVKVFKACLNVRRCKGITVWGIPDSASWVPSVFKGYGAPLLFDGDYKKKPAYRAVEKLLW